MKQNPAVHNSGAYRSYTWFLLAMVFVVILAGGVVRMTQSGMGCPDWPTCFGRWVPPVNASQLPADFEKYLKQQDIDHTFNVYHTWIEYINRLLGALLGILILVHAVWSYRLFIRTRKSIVALSVGMVLMVGFQGWLGKTVVDANLAVVKITAHMIVALLLAAIPVIILAKMQGIGSTVARKLRVMTVVTIALLLLQIILGTEVREQIDEISKRLDYTDRDQWIAQLDHLFIVHRSFSWLVFIACCYLFWQSRKYPGIAKAGRLVMVLVIVALGAGLIMNFFAVPAIAQPVHLLAASSLSMALLWLRLKME